LCEIFGSAYGAAGQVLVLTKDPAAGLRGVIGVDDMADALDKLGDRDRAYGEEERDGDANERTRGEGRERESRGEQPIIAGFNTGN